VSTPFSKRSYESELVVDHRDSPGVSHEDAARAGHNFAMPGGTVFKSPTITCTHCKRVVILNPDRSRSRGYCRNCDHDICDRCALMMKLGHPCQPFERIAEGLSHFLTSNPPSKGTT
jgi:hypothetical protein